MIMPLTMSINLTQIKLRDLFDGYVNFDENGVIGYHGRLDIRPKYQREFIYGEKEHYPEGKTEYEYSEMEGDHVLPWSQGGHTEESNCQMLCKWHNGHKSDD